MHADSFLIQALVYLAAGVISVPIAKRLGLGSVLGYLIAGALVGPFVLDLVGEQGDVMRFGEFGVVILLFLIGLEVRPALLWEMRTSIFGLGLAQMLASAALMGAVALMLGADWRVATAAGLILALSSTAIVLQNLEEKGLRQGPIGQAAFGVLLFQDLAVIPLFAFLPLLAIGHQAGVVEASGHGGNALAGLPEWARVLATFGAVAGVVIGGRYLTRPMFRFIAAARLREIFTASALLLVVGVAALMELVGLSPALGAFLAGVVLAESEFRRELETDIEPFRGLLLGLFFITVGAGLNFGLIVAQPVLVISLTLGLMAAKFVAMWAVGLLFRRSRKDAATIAVSLAQGGEFAFVLIAFVLTARVLTAEQAALATAVVALSMALTPIAFVLYEKLVLNRTGLLAEPEQIPFDEGAPDAIVAGFGRFGQIATRLLTAADFKVTMLESSIEQIETIRRFGWRVHYGDATRLDLLRAAGADKAKVLLVAIDDKDKAVELVKAATEYFPNLTIIARAFDRRHAYELVRVGGDEVVRETFESALVFGKKALLRLGMSDRRAAKAVSLFRDHDLALFNKLAPVYGEEERYAMAVRDSRETMEKLLSEEMRRLKKEEAEEADNDGKAKALREAS
ncbi:MAG: monovalent cation:proton antiporter-2 (CPA2) family protein [Alphaproteobacteria bacterium]|nr:monovalent cation:proton antiporter-2 (CPA2) family protein [Alphaproteobacteria bacterium]MBU1517002.1 monovalent cation:proton antiporter-2 (CPA2) family protein [Alphaproteobacteria bacterium]MBU2093621.1 monovalent cation:proton antiporter-2 (CPA2) family protein [Alphaproteobacteria bacterium]MBU2151007.1 monovalent cation:proton antiporter-2 (CPA2) family protein [Alphaproteobacteria bacterium]MBU2308779.1 monovalent cation:proton antiporter-2 (CPA2) family protein [Alphaproteobacteria